MTVNMILIKRLADIFYKKYCLKIKISTNHVMFKTYSHFFSISRGRNTLVRHQFIAMSEACVDSLISEAYDLFKGTIDEIQSYHVIKKFD